MSRAPLSTVRIRYRSADVLLTEGQYLMGRSASCQIVLDHPRVSRKHARLTVEQGKIVLEDLGSVNGVYVNGERIVIPHVLASGDHVVVGGEQLEVHIEGAQPTAPDRQTQHGIDSIPPAPPSTRWDAVTGGTGTQKADVFELVGKIADRSLAEGRAEEAENLLRSHLAKVLEQAKRTGHVADNTRQSAIHYALELALAVKSSRWIAYTIDVLANCRVLLPEALARDIQSAMTRVPGVEVERLDAYLHALSLLENSLEKAQTIARVEGLKRAAAGIR
jgi:pSer/pThr/pTyr-binding forkhead associated (FHA) protein